VLIDSLFSFCPGLKYKIVEAAESGDRLVATADDFTVARAAFDTAVALWPAATIELRQKARVILKSSNIGE
jgi:hypothetical protein